MSGHADMSVSAVVERVIPGGARQGGYSGVGILLPCCTTVCSESEGEGRE